MERKQKGKKEIPSALKKLLIQPFWVFEPDWEDICYGRTSQSWIQLDQLDKEPGDYDSAEDIPEMHVGGHCSRTLWEKLKLGFLPRVFQSVVLQSSETVVIRILSIKHILEWIRINYVSWNFVAVECVCVYAMYGLIYEIYSNYGSQAKGGPSSSTGIQFFSFKSRTEL